MRTGTGKAGVLYVVATPLGNLADITYRAVQVLKDVDLIAAEDTRHSRPLLTHYGIETRTISLHEHNEQARARTLTARLLAGESIALISDAGTPVISDPGYRLIAGVRDAGVRVSPVPGPSALIAALSAAGLPTDRFVFEGFLPAKAGARRRRLEGLATETRTLVIYESSHRIEASVADMRDAFGPERRAVIARELTKAFETLHDDALEALCQWLADDSNHRRGEFVVIVAGATELEEGDAAEVRRVLSLLLRELSPKIAVRLAAQLTGESRNRVYEMALALSRNDK
ncbi:MAG: 16S rRNA (cytidine(1402)-2'-O)-methyltransferase [Gammaproteobacteria bacterium]|nr:16S rRNA (cytidine(1402)-2'-O)-methyltransferase [Gammaproteobacteria bacterium]